MRLTELEIKAIIDAAGNCDVPAMLEDEPDQKLAAKLLDAYESGMEKMRVRLAEFREKPKQK